MWSAVAGVVAGLSEVCRQHVIMGVKGGMAVVIDGIEIVCTSYSNNGPVLSSGSSCVSRLQQAVRGSASANPNQELA